MEKETRKIAVIDYSPDPGPRYTSQGEHSGEDYYHNVLNSQFDISLKEGKILEISLDGTSGYASSFLDEAFGNLVYDFSLDLVKKNIKIISEEEPEWIDMIENQSFEEWEKRRIGKKEPKKTVEHAEWFRYEGSKLVKGIWIKK